MRDVRICVPPPVRPFRSSEFGADGSFVPSVVDVTPKIVVHFAESMVVVGKLSTNGSVASAHCERHVRVLRKPTIAATESGLEFRNVLTEVIDGFIVELHDALQCWALQLCPSSWALRSVAQPKPPQQSDCTRLYAWVVLQIVPRNEMPMTVLSTFLAVNN